MFGKILKKDGEASPLEPQTPLEFFFFRLGLIIFALGAILIWLDVSVDTFWQCAKYTIFWGGGVFAVAYMIVFLISPFTRR